MKGMTADDVAREFHERVEAQCENDLVKPVIELHRPHSGVGLPECQGCDAVPGVDGCPEWPCTTYSMIAMAVLDFEDVRKVLFDLTTAGSGPAAVSD